MNRDVSDPNSPGPDPETPGTSARRTFCKGCIVILSASSVAMVGYPVIGFLQRSESLDANKPLEVPLSQLSPGQAQYLDLHGQQVVVLLAAEAPQVFSASCPHLGCNVNWDSGDAIFRCPCHGAMFNARGEVIRGPASVGLTKLPFEIQDGKLIIS